MTDHRRVALLIGPAQHGVVQHGRALADAAGWPVLDDPDPPGAGFGPGDVVVAEVTDRLFGTTAEVSGPALRAIAARVHEVGAALVVSLHDVPAPADGAVFERRAHVYRGVIAVADAVLVASEVDRARLRALAEREPRRLAVLPLPVPTVPGLVRRPSTVPRPESVTVFGFLYPGKGHDEVVKAMSNAPRVRDLPLILAGRAAEGHEDLGRQLAHADVVTRTTGYLPEADLAKVLQAATIPVAPSRRVASSASVLAWWACQRRPLMPASEHGRELQARSPAGIELYDTVDDLTSALEAAFDDPGSTWLPGAVSGADVSDIGAIARQRDRVLDAWAL